MAKILSYLKESYVNTSFCDLKFALARENAPYVVNIKLSKGLSLDQILSDLESGLYQHLKLFGYLPGKFRIYLKDGITEVSPSYIPRKSQTFQLKRIYEK